MATECYTFRLIAVTNECTNTLLAASLLELLFDLKMDTLRTSETSVNFYQTT
jgi:hypothetical protein